MEISIFVPVSPSEFSYGHLWWYSRGKTDQIGMAVDVRGGVFKIFHSGDHKWMTAKLSDYRNPCKDLKF